MVLEIEDEVTTSPDDEEVENVPTKRSEIVTVEVASVTIELVFHDILKQNCDALWIPLSKDFLPLKGPGTRVLNRGTNL